MHSLAIWFERHQAADKASWWNTFQAILEVEEEEGKTPKQAAFFVLEEMQTLQSVLKSRFHFCQILDESSHFVGGKGETWSHVNTFCEGTASSAASAGMR